MADTPTNLNYGPELIPQPDFPTPQTDYLTPVSSGVSTVGSAMDPYANIYNDFDKDVAGFTKKQDFFKAGAQTAFNAESLLFDKYESTNHGIFSGFFSDFDEKGFIPWRDNEDTYNQDTSFTKEMYRSTKWAAPLFGEGFVSGLRTFPDLINGMFTGDMDALFSTDDYLAEKWGRATKMGGSTAGGMSTFFTNFEISTANMLGTLAEIAVEDALLGWATAQTGGAAGGIAAARITSNGARAIKSIYEGIRNIGKVMDVFKDVNAARKFYEVGAGAFKASANFINPLRQTTEFAKALYKGDQAFEGTTAAFKAAQGFGSFYRDLREINFALTEAKLEGGFSYLEQKEDLTQRFVAENGRLPMGDEARLIEENARGAGDFVTKSNLGVIYLSNRIGFGNLFKGYKPLDKLMGESAQGGVFKYINLNKAGDAFEKSTDAFDLKKAFRSGVGTSLNYFKANLSEGLQENAQEVIGAAAKDYYTKQFNSPAYGGVNVMMGDISAQMGENVFSAKGAETFASGFLMGAVIGGGMKAKSGIEKLSYRVFQPEKYADFKLQREEQIGKYITSLNEVYKDPLKYFSPELMNAARQGSLNQFLAQAVANKNEKAFYDIKDQSVYEHLYTVIRSGKTDIFKDKLSEMKQLKADEFEDALGFKVDKAEDFQTYIDEKVNQLNRIENMYKESQQKLANPVNLSAFKKGTPEYNSAAIDYMAFENARQQALFANYSFMRNGERMLSLLGNIKNVKLMNKTNFLDLAQLTSNNLVETEIDVLQKEIKSLEQGDAESKELAKQKQRRLDTLKIWSSVMNDPEIQAKGKFPKDYPSIDNPAYENWRRAAKLAFEKYVEVESSINKDSYFRDGVNNAFDLIMDYHTLNKENDSLVESMNVLSDPKNFMKLYKGHYTFMTEIYRRRSEIITNSFVEALRITDENNLVNKLAKLGFVEDPETPGQYFKMSAEGWSKVEPGSAEEQQIKDVVADHKTTTEKPVVNLVVNDVKIPKEEEDKPEENPKEAEDTSSDDAGKVINITIAQPYINPVHGVAPIEFEVKVVRDSAGDVRYFEWNIKGSDKKTRETVFSDQAQMENYLQLVAFKEYMRLLRNGKFKDAVSFNRGESGYSATLNKPFSNKEFPVSTSVADAEMDYALVGDPLDYSMVSKQEVDDYKEIRAGLLQQMEIDVDKAIAELKSKGREQKQNNAERFITSVQNPVSIAAFTEQEKAALRKAVMENTPEEFAKGLTIKVVKTEPKRVLEPSTANRSIKVFRNILPVSAELYFNGQRIGYFTYPDVYDFEINGVKKTVDQLSAADFSALAKDSAGTLEQFKINHAVSLSVYNSFAAVLGNKDAAELSNDQANALVGFDLRMGDYAYTEATRSLNALENDNVKLIAVYDKINKDKQVAGATLSAEQQENLAKLEKAMVQLETKTQKMGRYIAVYEHPNGQYSYVEVKTPAYSQDDLNELFARLSDRMELTRQTNVKMEDNKKGGTIPRAVDNQFNKQFNNQLLADLFIALNPTERGVKGVYASVSVSSNGDLKIQFTDNNQKKNFDIFVPVDYNADGTLKNIKSLDRLLREINLQITNYNSANGVMLPTLDKEMFRQSLPRVSDFDQLKRQGTNVSEQIRTEPRVYFFNKQAAQPQPAATTAVLQPNVSPLAQAQGTARTEPVVATVTPTAPVVSDKTIEINNNRNRNKEQKNAGAPVLDGYGNGWFAYYTPEGPENRVSFKTQQEALDWIDSKYDAELAALKPSVSVSDIEAKKADIEERRKEELEGEQRATRDEKGKIIILPALKEDIDRVNIKYDAELAALEGANLAETAQPAPKKKRGLGGLNLANRSIEEAVSASDVGEGKPAAPAATINLVDAVKQRYSEQKIDLQRKKDGGKLSAAEYAQSRRKIEQEETQELQKLAGKTTTRSLKRSKIGSEEFSAKDIEDIDTFADWIANNLPDVFTVEEIYKIAEKLSGNKVRMGRFMAYVKDVNKGLSGIRGKIQVGDRFRYHEAFHAVFQLLLTDDQLTRVLKAAEYEFNQSIKGKKIMSQALKEFRDLYKEEYAELSDEELKERMLEEYLADRFDAFKNTQQTQEQDNIIFKIFRKLKEFVKRLFQSKSQVEDLFTRIDSGKFRNVNIQSNRYTRQLLEGAPVIEAFKIKYGVDFQQGLNGNLVMVDKYFSEADTQRVVGAIVNSFMYREKQLSADERKNITRGQLMDQVLESFQKLYNIDSRYDSLPSDKLDRLFVYNEVFNGEMSQTAMDALKETAGLYLDLMGYEGDLEGEDYEMMVDDLGDRRSTESYDEAFSKGGLKSLSGFTRRYIQSTAFNQEDEFGNAILDEQTGEQLMSGVNAGVIYNGLVKAMAGVTSEKKFISRLYHFADENEQTKAFITKFISDTGLVYDSATGEYSVNANPGLFMSVFKSFTLFQTEYTTMLIDPKTKAVRWLKTNKKDAAANQYNRWQWQFMKEYQDMLSVRPELKTQLLGVLDLLQLPFGNTSVSDEDLNTFVDSNLKMLQKLTGIKISPKYFKYSVVAHLTGKNQQLTEAQKELYNSFDEVTAITREDLLEISKTIASGKNPFLNFEGSLAPQEEEEDMGIEAEAEEDDEDILPGAPEGQADMGRVGNQSRLITMAANNAIFDETVLATNWQNAEGKTVYAHQLPTFHLGYINDTIKVESELRQLIENDPFLQDTFMGKQIMEGKGIARILKDLNITRIDGVRQIFGTLVNGKLVENRRTKANQREGKTYGSFGAQEFLLSTLHLYLHNKKIALADKSSVTTSRHLIRVLEASSTGDTINLPVIQAVYEQNKEIKLSEVAREHFFNEFLSEYNRIGRAQQEINEINAGAFTGGVIEDYHNGKLRGLAFRSFESLLGPLVGSLTEQAKASQRITEQQKADIINQIEKAVLGEKGLVDDMIAAMVDNEVLTLDEKNGNLVNNLLSLELFGVGNDKSRTEELTSDLNLKKGKLRHNVAQIFVNDFLNTMSFNKLLLGDQSMSLKDFIDAVKRAKGANGSGYNLRSEVLAPELGINHAFTNSYFTIHDNPEYQGKFSGKTQDRADAQMWGTVKGFRYIMHSLGRLDNNVASFLDKVERGEAFDARDIFFQGGSVSFNAQTSVLKLVYYDGKQYIKTSMFVLSKRYTSRLNDTTAAKVSRLKAERNKLDNNRVASAIKINKQIDALLRDNNNYQSQIGMELLHNKRTELEKFEAAGRISFSIPKSAAKGLKRNVSGDLVGFAVTEEGYSVMDNKYFRLQTENPTNKKTITDPTQARQIIDTEQDDAVEVMFMGQIIKVGELRKMYQQDTANRVSLKYVAARNKIFTLEGLMNELQTSIDRNQVTAKLAEFQEQALRTLQSMGSTGQLYDFFKVDEDPATGIKSPRYDLNHPYTRGKYVQLFLAYFRRDVLSEKVPGHALTLVSDFGVNTIKQVTQVRKMEFTDEAGNKVTRNVPIEWKVIRREEYLRNPSKYEASIAEAKANLEEHDLQVGQYFLDELRFNVPEVDQNGNIIPGKYFTEFMTAPHFAEMMKLDPGQPIPDAIAKAFAVRIPSDDKHSFVSLRMVDFLPANYGSSGVFPKELIEISGADFDVDKVYMQIPDTYTVRGKDEKVEFRPYGYETTPEGKRFEFITWNLQNNKELKRKLKELKAIEDFDDLTIYDTATATGDFKTAKDLFDAVVVADTKAFLTETAIREVGLPYTQQEFDNYVKANSKLGEVNIGVLNNRILEAKQLLLTNDGQTTLATEVVSIEPLEKLTRDSRLLPGIIQERNIDPDHLLGKLESFRNNQEGQKNIAPAVNGMLAYTLLNKFKVKLRKGEDIYALNIDGVTFDGYDQNRTAVLDNKGKIARDRKGNIQFIGERIFNGITAIVNAMTDNAKERLAAKLNLNIDAVGVATDLTSRGVPMELIEAMLLNPAVKEYYKIIRSTKNGIRIKNSSRASLIEQLVNKYKAQAGTDERLPLTSEMLFEGVKGGSSQINLSVLLHFLDTEEQSRYFSDLSQLMKLSKGLGSDFEYWEAIKEKMSGFGLNMQEETFQKSSIPFDIRDVVMNKHLITATYLQIAAQLESLEKTMFIEKTELFKTVMSAVETQMSIKPVDYDRFAAATRNNMLVFIGLKGYLKKLQDENAEVLSLLDNRLIYDGDQSFDGIVPILRLAAQQSKDNYLLNRFLNVTPQTVIQDGKAVKNENNYKGINAVESNTWGKLDAYQLERLRNSFTDLYSSGNINLRRAALALFAYAVVKDGTQFKSNSLMEIIPVYMYDDLFSEIMPNVREIFSEDNLVQALKKDSVYLQDFRAVFGTDFKSMVAEFMTHYMSHSSNAFYLKRIKNSDKKKENFKFALDKDQYAELSETGEMTMVTTVDRVNGQYDLILRGTNDVLFNVSITRVGQSKQEGQKAQYTYELKADKNPDVRDQDPVFTSQDGELMHVNIFRNVKDFELVDTFDPETDTYIKQAVEREDGGKFTNNEKERFKRNIAMLIRRGFRIFRDKETGYIMVDFPLRFRMRSTTGKKDMYYELTMLNKIRTNKKDIQTISLKDAFDDNFKFTASMATYRQVEPVGSFSTAPISGMFGTIPEYEAYAQRALGYTDEERQRLVEGTLNPGAAVQQAAEWEANYGGAVNTGTRVTETDRNGVYPDDPWEFETGELLEDYSQTDGSVIGSGVSADVLEENTADDLFDKMPVRDKLKYKHNITFRMDGKTGKIVYKQGKEKYNFEGTPEQLLRSFNLPALVDIPAADTAPKPKRRLGGGFNLSNRSITEDISKNDLGNEVNEAKDQLDCKNKRSK